MTLLIDWFDSFFRTWNGPGDKEALLAMAEFFPALMGVVGFWSGLIGVGAVGEGICGRSSFVEGAGFEVDGEVAVCCCGCCCGCCCCC